MSNFYTFNSLSFDIIFNSNKIQVKEKSLNQKLKMQNTYGLKQNERLLVFIITE